MGAGVNFHLVSPRLLPPTPNMHYLPPTTHRPSPMTRHPSFSHGRMDTLYFRSLTVNTTSGRDYTPLTLAKDLFDLGAVTFGDFTLGRTAVHSPVYVNPRRILSEPVLLRKIAEILDNEIRTAQGRRRARLHPFSLVAGVPFGGLHLA